MIDDRDNIFKLYKQPKNEKVEYVFVEFFCLFYFCIYKIQDKTFLDPKDILIKAKPWKAHSDLIILDFLDAINGRRFIWLCFQIAIVFKFMFF